MTTSPWFPYLMAAGVMIVGVVGIVATYLSGRRAVEASIINTRTNALADFAIKATELRAARLTAGYSELMKAVTAARVWVTTTYSSRAQRYSVGDVPEEVAKLKSDGARQLGWSDEVFEMVSAWLEALDGFIRATDWMSKVNSGQVDPRQAMGMSHNQAKAFYESSRDAVLRADTVLRLRMQEEFESLEQPPKL